MALTKARPPVTEISQMLNGTTQVDIPNAGADIDIDVAGNNVIDLGQTSITVDDLVQLVVNDIAGRVMTQSFPAGAAGAVQVNATEMEVGTTSLHPLELLVNSTPLLTLLAGGEVSLANVGTAGDRLIDKDYVDNLVGSGGGAVTPADIVANLTTNGSIQIPTSAGDEFVINWGVTAPLNNASTTVTFDTAFPNAIFTAYATRENGDTGVENAPGCDLLTLTNMRVVQTGGSSTDRVFWLALGY